MKKIMMLGLVCLTLFGGQAVMAQNPQVKGVFEIRYIARARDSRRVEDWYLERFQPIEVSYDESAKVWTVVADGRNHDWEPGDIRRVFIKYYKTNDLLTIELGGRATKPGRSMWRLRNTGKHTVSVSEDNSSLTIIFTRSIEGTSNRERHWNIMKKSRLDITR